MLYPLSYEGNAFDLQFRASYNRVVNGLTAKLTA